MSEETSPQDNATLDLLYNMALKVLDKQMESIDGLDSKIRGIFAFITLIFGAFASFLSSQSQKLPSTSIILFWIVVLVFIAIVVFSVLAYAVRKVKYLLYGRPLLDIAQEKFPTTFLKEGLLKRLTDQHQYNEDIIFQKARYTRIVIYLTFVSILFIVALLILQALRNNPAFSQIL